MAEKKKGSFIGNVISNMQGNTKVPVMTPIRQASLEVGRRLSKDVVARETAREAKRIAFSKRLAETTEENVGDFALKKTGEGRINVTKERIQALINTLRSGKIGISSSAANELVGGLLHAAEDPNLEKPTVRKALADAQKAIGTLGLRAQSEFQKNLLNFMRAGSSLTVRDTPIRETSHFSIINESDLSHIAKQELGVLREEKIPEGVVTGRGRDSYVDQEIIKRSEFVRHRSGQEYLRVYSTEDPATRRFLGLVPLNLSTTNSKFTPGRNNKAKRGVPIVFGEAGTTMYMLPQHIVTTGMIKNNEEKMFVAENIDKFMSAFDTLDEYGNPIIREVPTPPTGIRGAAAKNIDLIKRDPVAYVRSRFFRNLEEDQRGNLVLKEPNSVNADLREIGTVLPRRYGDPDLHPAIAQQYTEAYASPHVLLLDDTGQQAQEFEESLRTLSTYEGVSPYVSQTKIMKRNFSGRWKGTLALSSDSYNDTLDALSDIDTSYLPPAARPVQFSFRPDLIRSGTRADFYTGALKGKEGATHRIFVTQTAVPDLRKVKGLSHLGLGPKAAPMDDALKDRGAYLTHASFKTAQENTLSIIEKEGYSSALLEELRRREALLTPGEKELGLKVTREDLERYGTYLGFDGTRNINYAFNPTTTHENVRVETVSEQNKTVTRVMRIINRDEAEIKGFGPAIKGTMQHVSEDIAENLADTLDVNASLGALGLKAGDAIYGSPDILSKAPAFLEAHLYGGYKAAISPGILDKARREVLSEFGINLDTFMNASNNDETVIKGTHISEIYKAINKRAKTFLSGEVDKIKKTVAGTGTLTETSTLGRAVEAILFRASEKVGQGSMAPKDVGRIFGVFWAAGLSENPLMKPGSALIGGQNIAQSMSRDTFIDLTRKYFKKNADTVFVEMHKGVSLSATSIVRGPGPNDYGEGASAIEPRNFKAIANRMRMLGGNENQISDMFYELTRFASGTEDIILDQMSLNLMVKSLTGNEDAIDYVNSKENDIPVRTFKELHEAGQLAEGVQLLDNFEQGLFIDLSDAPDSESARIIANAIGVKTGSKRIYLPSGEMLARRKAATILHTYASDDKLESTVQMVDDKLTGTIDSFIRGLAVSQIASTAPVAYKEEVDKLVGGMLRETAGAYASNRDSLISTAYHNVQSAYARALPLDNLDLLSPDRMKIAREVVQENSGKVTFANTQHFLHAMRVMSQSGAANSKDMAKQAYRFFTGMEGSGPREGNLRFQIRAPSVGIGNTLDVMEYRSLEESRNGAGDKFFQRLARSQAGRAQLGRFAKAAGIKFQEFELSSEEEERAAKLEDERLRVELMNSPEGETRSNIKKVENEIDDALANLKKTELHDVRQEIEAIEEERDAYFRDIQTRMASTKDFAEKETLNARRAQKATEWKDRLFNLRMVETYGKSYAKQLKAGASYLSSGADRLSLGDVYSGVEEENTFFATELDAHRDLQSDREMKYEQAVAGLDKTDRELDSLHDQYDAGQIRKKAFIDRKEALSTARSDYAREVATTHADLTRVLIEMQKVRGKKQATEEILQIAKSLIPLEFRAESGSSIEEDIKERAIPLDREVRDRRPTRMRAHVPIEGFAQIKEMVNANPELEVPALDLMEGLLRNSSAFIDPGEGTQTVPTASAKIPMSSGGAFTLQYGFTGSSNLDFDGDHMQILSLSGKSSERFQALADSAVKNRGFIEAILDTNLDETLAAATGEQDRARILLEHGKKARGVLSVMENIYTGVFTQQAKTAIGERLNATFINDIMDIKEVGEALKNVPRPKTMDELVKAIDGTSLSVDDILGFIEQVSQKTYTDKDRVPNAIIQEARGKTQLGPVDVNLRVIRESLGEMSLSNANDIKRFLALDTFLSVVQEQGTIKAKKMPMYLPWAERITQSFSQAIASGDTSSLDSLLQEMFAGSDLAKNGITFNVKDIEKALTKQGGYIAEHAKDEVLGAFEVISKSPIKLEDLTDTIQELTKGGRLARLSMDITEDRLSQGITSGTHEATVDMLRRQREGGTIAADILKGTAPPDSLRSAMDTVEGVAEKVRSMSRYADSKYTGYLMGGLAILGGLALFMGGDGYSSQPLVPEGEYVSLKNRQTIGDGNALSYQRDPSPDPSGYIPQGTQYGPGGNPMLGQMSVEKQNAYQVTGSVNHPDAINGAIGALQNLGVSGRGSVSINDTRRPISRSYIDKLLGEY